MPPTLPYVRVTKALDCYFHKPWLEKWKQNCPDSSNIGQKARDNGTKVHLALELYLRDSVPLPSTLPMGLGDVLDTVTPVYLEQRLGCPKLEFTGQLDCLGIVGGELTIVDFKTTKQIVRKPKPEWLAQLAAYRYLVKTNGMGVANKGLILQVGPDRIKTIEVTTDELRKGWTMFLCALDLYRGLN